LKTTSLVRKGWRWWRVWSFVIFKLYTTIRIFKRILLFKRDYLNTGKKIESIRVIRYCRYYMAYTQVFSHLNAILCSFNWIQFTSYSYVYMRYIYYIGIYVIFKAIHWLHIFILFRDIHRSIDTHINWTHFRIHEYKYFGRYIIVDGSTAEIT
jgi:hypothetical protein